MLRFRNIFKIAYLLIYLLPINLSAQEWTEPVVITSMPMFSNYPDIAVDNLGIIHCVWTTKLDDNFYKIYYSKSMDDGLSWSEPFDVSMNDDKWVSSPHIIADTNNNVLHVTYDYEIGNTAIGSIYHKSFENGTWSEIYNVSGTMPNAYHNRLAIDANNRLYCFWFTTLQNGTPYYRYSEAGNPAWSEFYTPYYNNFDKIFFEKIVIGQNNHIHCVGAHHYEGQSNSNDKIFYTKGINNVWDTISIISDSITGPGLDLALDANNLPHVVWRNKPPNSGYELDSTAYRYFNGNNWSKVELFGESDMTRYQQIVRDNKNKIHIVNVEQNAENFVLKHYFKENGNWVSQVIIEHDKLISNIELVVYNNVLYLVYARIDNDASLEISIVFHKKNIITQVINKNLMKNDIYIVPNPAISNVNFKFDLKKNSFFGINIFDLNGKLIKQLMNINIPAGPVEVKWNCTDNRLNKVKPGIYIAKIIAGKQVITRKIEIVN